MPGKRRGELWQLSRLSCDDDLARSLGLTPISMIPRGESHGRTCNRPTNLRTANSICRWTTPCCTRQYRRLAAEQAALRRLATLVARGVEPAEVFDAVVKEMRRCLLTERAGLWRFETSGEITLLAVDHRSPAPVKWPVGTRTPIDGNTLAAIGAIAPAGPRGWIAMRTAPGRSPHASERWACALRWACRSSSTDACGAWRPWVRLSPGPCRPTPRPASVASPN